MAKQVGPLFITGTIDGIIFYKLDGQYYMRSKGDYRSGKQMRKDPNLKRTMANADQFGQASKIVKGVYYMYLPPDVRKLGLFSKLTGMVKRWLQEGKDVGEIQEALIAHCQVLAKLPTVNEATPSVSATTPVLPPPATPAPTARQTKPAVVKPTHRFKQARYLSHWKVKRNGRLHIPKPVTPVYPPRDCINGERLLV